MLLSLTGAMSPEVVVIMPETFIHSGPFHPYRYFQDGLGDLPIYHHSPVCVRAHLAVVLQVQAPFQVI